MIRAILFDAVGTLIYLPRGAGWHYRHIAARHGLDLEEDALGRAFALAFREAAPRPATGIARPDDDKGWWRALVHRVLAACGQHPEEALFSALFEELYAHFAEPGVWALYPDARPVLQALHGRYTLGIVSNWDSRLRAVFGHLGILACFDAIVVSSETGADKPDPRIFAAALAALGAAPAETVHAGDDPAQDWSAAEAAGLRAFRVERPQRTLESLPAWLRTL